MSDVDTLSEHVLKPAVDSYIQTAKDPPVARRSQTLSRVIAVCAEDSSICVSPSITFWDSHALSCLIGGKPWP